MISPHLPEFRRLASQGNLIPVTCRILADIETPLSAYRKIRGHGESFLFESVEGGEHLGRYSFVGRNPRAVVRQTGSRVAYIEGGKVVKEFTVSGASAGDRPATEEPARQVGAGAVRDGLQVVERQSICRSRKDPSPPRTRPRGSWW